MRTERATNASEVSSSRVCAIQNNTKLVSTPTSQNTFTPHAEFISASYQLQVIRQNGKILKQVQDDIKNFPVKFFEGCGRD